MVAVVLCVPVFLRAQNDQRPSTSVAADLLHVPVAPMTGGWTTKREIEEGAAYLIGRRVVKDPALAAYWYGKAAAQGNAEAENELGYFYTVGLGVTADPVQAVKWYERAMAGGSRTAKLNLAVMSLKGSGIRQDPGLALELLQQLAMEHDSRAESYLGFMYELGYGVPADNPLAEKWLVHAAKHHAPAGEYGLGTLYSTAENHRHNFLRAAKLLRSSAKAGYVPAMYGLGMLLISHPELSRMPGEPTERLQAAAEGGFWQASAVLGILARDGAMNSVNMMDAYRWFTIAVRQGGPNAERLLEEARERCAAKFTAESREREDQRADAWLRDHAGVDLFALPVKFQMGPFPAMAVPLISPGRNALNEVGLAKKSQTQPTQMKGN